MAKRKHVKEDSDPLLVLKVNPVRSSSEPAPKKPKWVNKQRCLIFCSRGVSYRDRHLMKDFVTMMPHAKTETKMDRKDQLQVINEVCAMKNCTKCIYYENKKKKDLYMWIANVGAGPSAKFLVENVHTASELKMTGNCLKGSRPILSFSEEFDNEPHWMLLKELLRQTYGTPHNHPKSQPFVDHVFAFTVYDNRIWFRNYQIMEENGELTEIGPRMVLNPIKIFKGSFGGETLYSNPHYVTPNESRRVKRRVEGDKYRSKNDSIELLKQRREKYPKDYVMDETDAVFDTKANKVDVHDPSVYDPNTDLVTQKKDGPKDDADIAAGDDDVDDNEADMEGGKEDGEDEAEEMDADGDDEQDGQGDSDDQDDDVSSEEEVDVEPIGKIRLFDGDSDNE